MVVPETPAPEVVPEPVKAEEPVKEEAQKPQFVTEKQLEQVTAKIIREVKSADRQRAQQIKKELTALKTAFEAAGGQITPQIEEKLQDQIIAKYDVEEEPEAAPNVPSIVEAAIDMMTDADTLIEEGEPEFEQYIKPHLTTPGPKLLLATAKAIEAKQARLKTLQDKAELRTSVGGGEGPGEFKAKRARDYLERAHN